MLIKVVATPGARREKVLRIDQTRFEISVREEAERGEANQRIRELLALSLQIPTKSLRLKRGHRARLKTFESL